MANEEHLELLQQGVAVWNRWRRAHPMIQIDLLVADLRALNLSGAMLARANLSGADLREADLNGADLNDTNLIAARLNGANLNGARVNRADLLKADLLKARLNRADLSGANLSGADLSEAVLRRAQLHGANLSGALLSRADLSGADLSRADLSRADLQSARLTRTNLSEARLRQTSFANATVRGTLFAEVHLGEATNLETVLHTGPSSIGIETLYHSQGQIPDVFLRGTGVPERLIDYMRSLDRKASDSQRCYLISSSKDEAFAQRLSLDLQSRGVRCWLAPYEMKVGNELRPVIDVPVRQRDRLLLVLSEASIASTWARREVQAALEREEREQEPVLVLVRLDEAAVHTEVAWAAELGRTRPVADFTGWEDAESYQQALARLLGDLTGDAS